MMIPTMMLALSGLCWADGTPPEMVARRDRVEVELRKTNQKLAELLSIKVVMLRLLKEPGELQERFDTAQEELIEAKALDDGQDLLVLPVYYIKLDAIRIRGLALPGGRRFRLELTWQEPTERRETHDLNLEFDIPQRKTWLGEQSLEALDGHSFRVVFPSRVNLFVTWKDDTIEAVVVDGFARHRLSFLDGGEGQGRVESREILSENVVVPAPFKPGWWGVLARIFATTDTAKDPLLRPVIIPLCDGSTLVRPAAQAFDDDSSLSPVDRQNLRDMNGWGRNLFCAGNQAQADLFMALARIEVLDQQMHSIDAQAAPEESLPLIRSRAEAVAHLAEVGGQIDTEAAKTIEIANRLRIETEAIRREMTRFVQTSWLDRSPEFDSLIREAKALAKGGTP